MVIPVTTQHFPMLQRNLLYTGMRGEAQRLALDGPTTAAVPRAGERLLGAGEAAGSITSVPPRRIPRAVPRQPGPDQLGRDVPAVPVAPADPAAVRALLGEVAHHHLALDQLDHERLGSLAARLTRLARISTLLQRRTQLLAAGGMLGLTPKRGRPKPPNAGIKANAPKIQER